MAVRIGVLDAADLQPAQRVLDVGCGHGDITLLAARSVGPRGLALGVDASVPLIERARQRACEAGLANVGFLCADARTHRFAPLRFDVIISQIGLTRRAPDDAGFANLARALRRGGRLVFVSFHEPERVDTELRRAGLAQQVAARAETEGAPTWLVTAGALV